MYHGVHYLAPTFTRCLFDHIPSQGSIAGHGERSSSPELEAIGDVSETGMSLHQWYTLAIICHSIEGAMR
jgi:hypothetical protein